MTYDALTQISNNQSLIGEVFKASTSSLPIITNLGTPLSLAGRDVGNGANLAFRIHVTQAFNAGVASIVFNVVVSSDPNLASVTFIGATTVTATGLTLGNEFDIQIPSLSEYNAAGAEFLGLVYAPSAAPSAGAISAWIPLGHSPNRPRRLRANYTGPT